MPINLTLPNGRTVDVETSHGANYFINNYSDSDSDDSSSSSFEYFSSSIPHVQQINERVQRRGSNKRPTEEEIHELIAVYATATSLADNSDPDTFAKIPKSEIELYVDHVIGQIVHKTRDDERWKRTGTLEDLHDQTMIYGCIELFTHVAPCKVAFEKDYFGALSKFVAAPSSLSADDAESIVMIVTNALISVVFNKDILPSTEKAFKKLESAGILRQYIRLSSSSASFNQIPGVLKFYDELILCPSFVKRNFVRGQSCGDITFEILSNPSIRHRAVVQKLQTIMAFTNLIQQQKEVPPSVKEGFRMCRYCDEQSIEFQKSLRKCARCKSAFYCSRECQRADWKSHKPNCQLKSSSDAKANIFTETTVLNFCKANYCAIMKEIVKVSDETGNSKSDLLLELDFATPASGLAPPSLKSPPEFKIADSKGYFEGSRPNEPDWFYKNEDRSCYEANISNLMSSLKDTYERLADYHLLGFIRSPSGDMGCYRLTLELADKNQMFSEEAVSASRRAIQDGDFEPLSRIFGEDTVQMTALRRGFVGLPSESEMDRVRMALNRGFGANFSLSGDGA